MRAKPIVLLIPVVLLVVSALPAAAAEGDFSAGFDLYQRYCQSCHGERGSGDGRVGKYLKVPPADLTQLSEGNDGTFPEERLAKVIDGRNEVRTHGAKEMPVWGQVFGEEAGDGDAEALVDSRIAALIEVLRWFDGPPSGDTPAGD